MPSLPLSMLPAKAEKLSQQDLEFIAEYWNCYRETGRFNATEAFLRVKPYKRDKKTGQLKERDRQSAGVRAHAIVQKIKRAGLWGWLLDQAGLDMPAVAKVLRDALEAKDEQAMMTKEGKIKRVSLLNSSVYHVRIRAAQEIAKLRGEYPTSHVHHSVSGARSFADVVRQTDRLDAEMVDAQEVPIEESEDEIPSS